MAEVMGTKDKPKTSTRLASGDRDGDGKKDDNYYGVLHGADSVGVPAVILEHSFHTNKRAADWLLIDSNLDKLAKAEAEVLAKHFGVYVEQFKTYKVKINTAALNVRSGPGTKYKIATVVHRGEVFTIVGEENGWGKLKSGAGFISLAYTKKI